jgi:hypothetical protein
MEGLIPLYGDDYEEKRKLKLGEVYTAEIKLMRNLDFHRKYFKLISLAWEYLNEKQQAFIKTKENFRKYLEVSAGHCEPFYSKTLNDWVDAPKSISFEKMDNAEFSDLYDRVKDVLFLTFLKNISQEDFEKNLKDF